jgi:hypothetical protein
MSVLTINSLKTATPYTYLCRMQTGVYALYLWMHKSAAKQIHWDGTVHYNNGQTIIRLRVDDSNAISAAVTGYFTQKITLNPQRRASENGHNFSPDFFEVQVIVEQVNLGREVVTIKKNTIVYSDAADYVPEEEGHVAFNCPYLYLSNPQGNLANNGNNNEYEPGVILMLKGYSFSPEDQQVVISNGDCKVDLQLRKTGTLGAQLVPPNQIAPNNMRYTDADTVNGSLLVNVLVDDLDTEAPLLRNGRRRNKSSEVDANPFVDIWDVVPV